METTAVLQKTKWAIDPMHSDVQFKVKSLMISAVTGSFKKFNGTLTSKSEDFEDAEIQFSLDVNSISSNNELRDNHIKTAAEFFDADKYPQINFKSTSFKKKSKGSYLLIGNLTIKGITKRTELKVEFGGIAKDSKGNLKAGFEVNGAINRTDFGLNYNSLTESGARIVGEEIKLMADIQALKEKNN